jgi:hypothetical protein
MRVEPLATDRADTAAYQLYGPSLAELRTEASKRCPQGAQVLRASEARHYRSTASEPSVGRWFALAVDSVAPPAGTAQLMVICEPQPGHDRLAALPPVPAKPAPQSTATAWGLTKRGIASVASLFSPRTPAPTAPAGPASATEPKPRTPKPTLVPVTGYDE